MITLEELPKDYSEAVKTISENRHRMSEGYRNQLTIDLLKREINK